MPGMAPPQHSPSCLVVVFQFKFHLFVCMHACLHVHVCTHACRGQKKKLVVTSPLVPVGPAT